MSRPSVIVVDYGLGNLMSVAQALTKIGAFFHVSSTPSDIARADKVILPGVGAFSVAMRSLETSGIRDAILESARRGGGLLGICLGMQLLFEESAEFGTTQGLGLIPGSVKVVIPENERSASSRGTHIGWRRLQLSEQGSRHRVFEGITGDDSFYFVHSYAGNPRDVQDTLALVKYAGRSVVAAVARDNVIGVQFHPEKSGPTGLRLLEKFVAL